MELITILNRCHRSRGFVCRQARFSSDHKSTEVTVRLRRRSAAVCSRCQRPAPARPAEESILSAEAAAVFGKCSIYDARTTLSLLHARALIHGLLFGQGMILRTMAPTFREIEGSLKDVAMHALDICRYQTGVDIQT
jgi:hypothetical protein